eukprot:5021939-Ditylum_brightwellii.AAC.1
MSLNYGGGGSSSSTGLDPHYAQMGRQIPPSEHDGQIMYVLHALHGGQYGEHDDDHGECDGGPWALR